MIYKDQQTGNNNYEVALTFTDEGTKKFADVTAANVGKKIAIVYDNVMYSNPTVQQAITGGQASISGMIPMKRLRILRPRSVSVPFPWNWRNSVPTW